LTNFKFPARKKINQRCCQTPVVVFFFREAGNATHQTMFRPKRDKETGRFYLLPGMGGTAWRRKQNFILKRTVIAALMGAAALGALLYWLNHRSF
jgi:hypothetical protein